MIWSDAFQHSFDQNLPKLTSYMSGAMSEQTLLLT